MQWLAGHAPKSTKDQVRRSKNYLKVTLCNSKVTFNKKIRADFLLDALTEETPPGICVQLKYWILLSHDISYWKRSKNYLQCTQSKSKTIFLKKERFPQNTEQVQKHLNIWNLILLALLCRAISKMIENNLIDFIYFYWLIDFIYFCWLIDFIYFYWLIDFIYFYWLIDFI